MKIALKTGMNPEGFIRFLFILMLNQASTDRLELAKLLNISELQLPYITNVVARSGLVKVGSALVPFYDTFPHNTELYRMMSTKLSEISNKPN